MFREGTPYKGLYGVAPPERGTFVRLQIYERVGVSLVEVYERACKEICPALLSVKGPVKSNRRIIYIAVKLTQENSLVW